MIIGQEEENKSSIGLKGSRKGHEKSQDIGKTIKWEY